MAQMRGAFSLPPSSPQNTGSPGVIVLASGRTYNVPMGEFWLVPGTQTIIQYFDPLNNCWRATQGSQGQIEQLSSDGTNYRLLNASGIIFGATVTNAGSGGVNGIGPNQTGSTITFPASATGVATDQAQGYVIVGGTVAAPTVAQAGSGFLVPPQIICDPPPNGGIQALFTCTINAAGGIASITQVNAGAGYTSVPQFYIVPQFQFYNAEPRFPGDTVVPVQTGTNWAPGLINPAHLWNGSPYQGNIALGTLGALLTPPAAVGGSGTLTGVVMTYFGSGYTGAQSATATLGGTSLGAAAVSNLYSFCLIGGPITGSGGTGYLVGAPAITTLGFVAGSDANNQLGGRPGRGVVTNAAGPVFSIEDPGFGLQKTAVGIGGGPATALGTVPNANLGGTTDVSILQAMVQ